MMATNVSMYCCIRRQCTPIYKKNSCKLGGKALLKISSLVYYVAKVVAN